MGIIHPDNLIHHHFVIPLRGEGIAWTASPLELQDFGSVLPGNSSEAQTVTLTGSSGSGDFSYSLKNGQTEVFPVTETEGVYSASAGGNLEIRFAPQAFEPVYRDTLVILSAGSARIMEVPLSGSTPTQPVISADSTLYRFGEVVRGNTATGGRILVSLSNAQSRLDAEGVFTLARAAEYAAAQDSTFKVRRYLQGGTPQDPQIEVSLSFTPPGAGEYVDTLIIRAACTDEYRIPLSGTGTGDVAIRETKAATPQVWVRKGDIVVSQLAAGSRISVYNLHGRLVKTQTATSNVEILNTAAFPHGVYIVTLWNGKGEILRGKVAL
jgi:hypothetical protein